LTRQAPQSGGRRAPLSSLHSPGEALNDLDFEAPAAAHRFGLVDLHLP
jgi:hypothetical protein